LGTVVRVPLRHQPDFLSARHSPPCAATPRHRAKR
jgi:hypothetical protein